MSLMGPVPTSATVDLALADRVTALWRARTIPDQFRREALRIAACEELIDLHACRDDGSPIVFAFVFAVRDVVGSGSAARTCGACRRLLGKNPRECRGEGTRGCAVSRGKRAAIAASSSPSTKHAPSLHVARVDRSNCRWCFVTLREPYRRDSLSLNPYTRRRLHDPFNPTNIRRVGYTSADGWARWEAERAVSYVYRGDQLVTERGLAFAREAGLRRDEERAPWCGSTSTLRSWLGVMS